MDMALSNDGVCLFTSTFYITVLDEGNDISDCAIEVVFCAWGIVEWWRVDKAQQDGLVIPDDFNLTF